MTTLVYFAPVAWDTYLQRPHYVARHFLGRGGTRVLWIDPYPTRFPKLVDLRRRAAGAALPTPRPAGLTVVAPFSLPIEPLAAGQQLNHALFGRALLQRLRSMCGDAPIALGIGRPSSLALAAMDALRPAWSFFDALDDFPEFYDGLARKSVADVESKIAARVDVVLVPSTGLWTKFAQLGDRRLMVRNACDMGALPSTRSPQTQPPIAGFVGCISTWFDWPLVDRLARDASEVRFDISGPCFEGPPAPLPPNVVLLPACSHEEAVARMARFTVGLIPFTRNRLTNGVDPIKYYEYRGLGMPVLTTCFGEMARRGDQAGLFFAEEPGSLARALAAATSMRAVTATPLVDIDAFRRDNSWDRRFNDAGLFEWRRG